MVQMKIKVTAGIWRIKVLSDGSKAEELKRRNDNYSRGVLLVVLVQVDPDG